MRSTIACIWVAISIAYTTPAYADFVPDSGDLCYDGNQFMDSYLLFSSPGPFEVPTPDLANDPGYEHDLVFHVGFFQSCVSVTNLPSAYDDCPTAGISENPGEVVFSFGSFHAKQVLANTFYYGAWSFVRGGVPQDTITLRGQEVWHDSCPFDNIFCMLSHRSKDLIQNAIITFQGSPSCLGF
jgi:hypothetical protein